VKIKPSLPFFELLLIPMSLYFGTKMILRGLERSSGEGMLMVLVSVTLLGFVLLMINRNFKSVEVHDKIYVNGFFWGHKEFEFNDIKGYKLKEIRKGKYLSKDKNLVFIDNDDVEKIEITKGDYKNDDWSDFLRALTEAKIESLGKETLKNQWTAYFKRFWQ
jgi:hypothetical protein